MLTVIYYANAVFVFYRSLGMKVKLPFQDTVYFQQMNHYMNLFHINNGYGLFRVMTGVNGRPELEIKYLNKDKKWKNIDFIYKINSDTKARPGFNIPHQPRIDWQIWFSALVPEINTEPWLVILAGKIFEKNPVVLDLLGYYVKEKELYYQFSLFDQALDYLYTNRKKPLNDEILLVKIEKHIYHFNSYDGLQKTGDYWRKQHDSDFLQPTDKKIFDTMFKENFKLPFNKRLIRFSIFQLIPVFDLVLTILMLYLMIRLMNLK
jgi:Lipase maturation factor